MFFPDRITKIKDTDRVLEIGPGSIPYYRSDVFLELYFDSEKEAILQRSLGKNFKSEKQVVYYDGNKFPFKDNEFDYIICSHVIEHVPLEKLDLFISELKRVAPRGYLEFPRVFCELTNFCDVHLSFINYRDNQMLFMDKKHFQSNWLHKIYQTVFYLNNIIDKYREFFFVGFEWERVSLNYQIVNNFDELISEEDYNHWKKFFAEVNIPVETSTLSKWAQFKKRPIKFILGKIAFGDININTETK